MLWAAAIGSPNTVFPNLYPNTASQAVPEDDPPLSQRGQPAPLANEQLHQMCRKPFTPLHMACAQLLPEGGRKSLLMPGLETITPKSPQGKLARGPLSVESLAYASCGYATLYRSHTQC